MESNDVVLEKIIKELYAIDQMLKKDMVLVLSELVNELELNVM
jgi:hypothetical protein